jgi:hypothetical protein
MPSPRPLRSGIDYQIRYAVWRLVAIACGHDEWHAGGRYFRIEWPVADDHEKDVWCDFVIETAEGRILEIVECREHLNAVPLDSVEQFLRSVKRIRGGKAVSEQTRFRFVSPSWYSEDGRNLADPDVRDRVVGDIDSSLVPTARLVIWDFSRQTKTSLTNAACTEMIDRTTDTKGMFRSLYARLAAQLSHRWPIAKGACRDGFRDVLVDLFPGDPQRYSSDLGGVAPEDGFDIHDLQRRLNSTSRRAQLEADVRAALGARLYPDDHVTTRDVFIELNGRYEWIEGAERQKVQRRTTVTEALSDWLTDVHDVRALPEPLVVVGPFGAGKSTALKAFAARLLEASANLVVPIFIQLRDLARTVKPDQIDKRIIELALERGIEIGSPSQSALVCLICDGFDELNLYYSGSANAGWAREVYQQLRGLAARRKVAVMVSSRPLQLLDQLAEVSARGDTTRRISIEELTPEQIDEWCALYREKAKLPVEFSLRFLEERKLSSVARTPIILYMIARLYATAPALLPAQHYTLGEIYQRFVDWTVQGAYASEKKKHLVPSNYREVLQEIAWHLAQEKGGMLREHALLQHLRAKYGPVIEDVPVDVNLLVAHMLQPVDGDGDETDSLIEFTHQSFRDYLVAERVFRDLGGATGSLPADLLRRIAGHAVTPATLEFLFDILDRLSNDERRAFLARTVGLDDIQKVLPRIEPVNAGAAVTVAGLILLLRVRAASKLRDPEQSMAIRAIAQGIDAIDFRRLINVLDAFESDADVEATRGLLLRHLNGLSFLPGASLDGLKLELPLLREAAWRELSAKGMFLACGELSDSAFVDVRFTRSFLDILQTSKSSGRTAAAVLFGGCDFSFAELSIGRREKPANLEIAGSTLDRCHITHLFAEESSFIRNSWKGASIDGGMLIDCTLDREALAFFRSQGVPMANCRLLRAAGKWRGDATWDAMFDTVLRPENPTDYFQAAGRLLRVAIPELTTVRAAELSPSDGLVLTFMGEQPVAATVPPPGEDLTEVLMFEGNPYVIVVDRERVPQARTLQQYSVEKHLMPEATVWSTAELVDEAFFAVLDEVTAALGGHDEPNGGLRPYRRHDLWISRNDEGQMAVDRSNVLNIGDPRSLPVSKLEDERRARITIVTGPAGNPSTPAVTGLLDKDSAQWIHLAGGDIPPEVPAFTALLVSLAERFPHANPDSSGVHRAILHAVLADMARDPGLGVVIHGAHEAPRLIGTLRLFRSATAQVMLTMPRSAYETSQAAIEEELADWPADKGMAQPMTVLELLT